MSKKILSLLLCAVLFCGAVCGYYVSAPADAAVANSVADARNKISQIKENRAKLQKELDALKSQKADYMDQKAVLDQQINSLDDEIEVYDKLIEELTADIAVSEAQLAEAQAEYDANIDKYRQVARASYENGETTYLEVLLGAGSFSDFLLRMDYIKQQTAYTHRLTETIKESMRQITAEKQAIEENRAVQQESLDALEARRGEVAEKRADIQKLIDQVLSNEESAKAAEKKEAAMEAELNAYLEKELSKPSNPGVSYQTGEWIWPVAKASYNYVSSGYGWRTLFGKREFHYAIDIAAPANTPIYASKAGVVQYAGWSNYGGGWQVRLDHGNTYYSVYNHMIARPIVSNGQSVKQGQVIGYVGMTGTATGHHLDFKIYYKGSAQNPLNYVKNPY